MLRNGASHWRLMAAALAMLGLSACGSNSDAQTAKPSTQDQAAAPTAIPGEPSDSDGYSNIGDTVYFAVDASDLSADAQSLLQRQADWLKQYQMRNITVEGYADERGTREYNLGLGERRANSIANYLAALGIDKARVSVISYGKERPVCSDADDACWAQNRRGVTALTN